MPEHTSILSILLRSIFIGFGFVVPVAALLKTSDLKKLHFKELFILTAVQAVRVAGILYFLVFSVYASIVYFQNLNSTETVVVQSPLFGPYWYAHWYSPVFYLLLSQLLWIKKLYIKTGALIVFGLFFLTLPSKRFMFFITNINDNDSLAMLASNAGSILLEFALNIIVFIFIILTIMLSGSKLKKIKK